MGLWKKGGSADTQRLVPLKAGSTLQSKGSKDSEDLSIRSDGSIEPSNKNKPKGIFRRYKLPKFKKLVELDDAGSSVIGYQPPSELGLLASQIENNENSYDFHENKPVKNEKKSKGKLISKIIRNTPNKSDRPLQAAFSPLGNLPYNNYEPPPVFSVTLSNTVSGKSTESATFDVGENITSYMHTNLNNNDNHDEEDTVPTTISGDEGKEFRQFVFGKNFDTIDGVAVQKSEAGSNFNDFLAVKVVNLTNRLRQQHSESKMTDIKAENNTLSAKKRLMERRALKLSEEVKTRQNITNHRDVNPSENSVSSKHRRHGPRTLASVDSVPRQPIRRKNLSSNSSVASNKHSKESVPRTISSLVSADVSVVSNPSVSQVVIKSSKESFMSDNPFYQSEEEIEGADNNPFQAEVDDTDWGLPPPKMTFSSDNRTVDDPFLVNSNSAEKTSFSTLEEETQDPFLTLHKSKVSLQSSSRYEQDPFAANDDPFDSFYTAENVDMAEFDSANNPFDGHVDKTSDQADKNSLTDSFVQSNCVEIKATPSKQRSNTKSRSADDGIIESIRNSAMKCKGKDADEASRKPDPPSPRSARRLKKKQRVKTPEVKLSCSDSVLEETRELGGSNTGSGPFSASKQPPTGVPANAILGSMLFRAANPDVIVKTKMVHDNGDDDYEEEEGRVGEVPPAIVTDGSHSSVSSVTEEASSFYQKNFLWNKQAHNALARFNQMLSDPPNNRQYTQTSSKGSNQINSSATNFDYFNTSDMNMNYFVNKSASNGNKSHSKSKHRKGQKSRNASLFTENDNINLLEKVEEERMNNF